MIDEDFIILGPDKLFTAIYNDGSGTSQRGDVVVRVHERGVGRELWTISLLGPLLFDGPLQSE